MRERGGAAAPSSSSTRALAESGLAGIVGGSVTALVVSPLDVARTRLQLQATVSHLPPAMRASGVLSALRLIVQTEGISGLWRGYRVAGVAIPVFWAVYFPVYETSKLFWLGSLGQPPAGGGGAVPRDTAGGELHVALAHSMSAISAAIVSDSVTNPLWVVRTRMQSHRLHVLGHDAAVAREGAYRGVVHALVTISRTEGVRALYKGLLASWLGATHSAVQFPLYEHLKLRLELDGAAAPDPAQPPATAAPVPIPTLGTDLLPLKFEAEDAALGVPRAVPTLPTFAPVPVHVAADMHTAARLVLASTVSKVCASLLTYPHEVIRARLQDQRSPPTAAQLAAGAPAFVAQQHYNGIIDCARTIYRQEGIAGLYSGFSANLVRALPATAVMLVTYEESLRVIKERNLFSGIE